MKIRLKGDEKLQVVDYNKKQQARPTEIKYGLELPLILEFYHDDGSVFAEEELSIYTSFQFAIDEDFDFTTNPPILANNSTTTFVISGNTISFTAMTDTAAFKALIGDDPSAEAYGEFKAYKPGKTRPGLAPVFKVMAYNAVAADGSEEPSTSPELYITTAEAYALVQSAPDFQFSVDGATDWHETQVAADRYRRESRNGGEWSEAVALVVGATGDSAYVYVAYASDDTGSDFSLTPDANLLYRAEIHTNQVLDPPVEADFASADWGKMGHSVYSMAGFASDDSGSDFSMIPNDSLPYIAFVYITDMGEYLSSFDEATWVKYIGADVFTYVAYASDNSGTDWNLTPSDTLKYRAEIHSATALTPVVGDFSAATWIQYLGDDGADGTDGTNGTGVAPQGEYAAGTTYALNEGVTYDGSYYRSKVADNTGNQPDTSTTQWELMISKGDTGDTGATGSTNVCFVTAPAFDSTLECLVFPLDDVNAVLKTDRVPSISNLKANVISANSSFTGNVVIYPTSGRTELTQAGWTASTGVSGAYYRATAPGTEPTLTTEDTSMLKKVADTASLVAGSWCWDDGDTLGYDTLYVYPNTSNDPTSDDDGFYQYDTVSSQTIAVGASEAEKTITISSTTPLSVELWRDTNDASDTLVDGSSVPVSVYFSTLEYNK